MADDPIVARSMGELRRAAAEGRAYYSCERFEDPYGRLVVGIGARLEGLALRTVAWTGRKSVRVSPVPLHIQGRYRASLDDPEEKADAIPEGIDELFRVVARMHPEAARRLMKMNPRPRDLAHGLQVGTYVRRLMAACNAIQRSERFRYSPRDKMSGFVAGLVHDIGCWNGHGDKDHAARGADLLRNLISSSDWIRDLSDVVRHHHAELSQFSGKRLFRIAPVALAETMVECSIDLSSTLCDLVTESVPEFARDLLISLCNLEHCAPPLSVVRCQNREKRIQCDLAVSLKCGRGEAGPYLLRFARVDARGRSRPVELADRCLIGPQHPDYECSERVVVNLLPEAVYERLFKDYEGLIPIYRRVMEKSDILT